MAIAVKHTGSAIDLTSISTNKDLAPVATPRLGGFTLRNRFSGALAVTLSNSKVVGASSAVKNNPIYVMDVPRRTFVKKVNVFAVEGKTVPGHAFTYGGTSASLSASDQNLNLTFIAQPIKKDTGSAVTYDSISASLTLGTIGLTEATNSLPKGSFASTPLVAVSSRVSSTTSSATKAGFQTAIGIDPDNAHDAGGYFTPRYFPHGGRVVMTLTGSVVDNDSKINNLSGVCSGVWEVQAECEYVPE